ncbi:MAG: hypothetical protein WCI73_12910 [Phycisphaerae bacterium]
MKRLTEALWAASLTICQGQAVTPGLVTAQAQMQSLARRIISGKDLSTHPLMEGWPRECLGQKLLDLLAGKLAVRFVMKDQELCAEFAP